MDAAVWTAIGLLASFSLGTLVYLGSQIDSLAARMDQRFDAMDGRFHAVDPRFDAMDARFDAIGARSDSRFDSVASGSTRSTPASTCTSSGTPDRSAQPLR